MSRVYVSFDVPDVLALLLRVVDSVSAVQVHVFENVQDWENLSVVWNQRLADDISRDDQVLQYLKKSLLIAAIALIDLPLGSCRS